MDSNLNKDEREGLPSASGIEQLKLCPGSFDYQKEFSDIKSGDASEGTLRHDLIEQVIRGKMDISEIKDDAQADCVERSLSLLGDLEQEIDAGKYETQSLEERLWVRGGDKKIYSAKYDLLREYKNGIFLLVDWKTLYGEHTRAQDNIQLLSQAIAVHRNTPAKINKMYCALVEPFPSPSYSLVEYSEERLELGYDWVRKVIEEANENAPRIPGAKQCKFCKALSVCPESRTVITKALGLKPNEISSGLLSQLMEVAQLAEKWASGVKSRVKELLLEDEGVDGWQLRGSGSIKSIDNADECAKVIMETNQLTWTEFLEANKTSYSGLIKVWMKKREIGRKEAISELEAILGDIIQEKQKSKSIAKA